MSAKKTFYVEIVLWVEADNEDAARSRAHVLASIIESERDVTSATVNDVADEDS